MRPDYFTEDMLKDKTIVISGGCKGVGRLVAVDAAKYGADVVISGRDEKTAGGVIQEIESYGRRGVFVKMDLKNADDIKRLFDTAMDTFGKVDGFVNYAGITPAAPITEESVEQLDSVFDVNLRAPFLACKYAINCMQKNENGGSIVLFGSPHASFGQKDRAAYSVSKGGLLTLMNHIAHHYACDRIRANYITMGWTITEGEVELRKSQGMTLEELKEFAKPFIPMGRLNEPGDMVPGVMYLLSDAAAVVTGSDFCMTGGLFF